MLLLVVYAVLALVVVAALVVLAIVVLPPTEQLADAPRDRAPWQLPAGRPMTESDLTAMRLPVTVRGYRFAETDALLDRVAEELAARDRTIATLQAELAERGGGATSGSAEAGRVTRSE